MLAYDVTTVLQTRLLENLTQWYASYQTTASYYLITQWYASYQTTASYYLITCNSHRFFPE